MGEVMPAWSTKRWGYGQRDAIRYVGWGYVGTFTRAELDWATTHLFYVHGGRPNRDQVGFFGYAPKCRPMWRLIAAVLGVWG